jgi:hypothetical protein
MGKNQDPGSGINIPDPQHLFIVLLSNFFVLFPNVSISLCPKHHVNSKLGYVSPDLYAEFSGPGYKFEPTVKKIITKLGNLESTGIF